MSVDPCWGLLSVARGTDNTHITRSVLEMQTLRLTPHPRAQICSRR